MNNKNHFIIFLFISIILHIGLVFLLPELKQKSVEPAYPSIPVDIIDIFKKPKGEIVELPPMSESKPKQEKPSKSDAKWLADRTMQSDKETSPKPMPKPKHAASGQEGKTAKKDESAAKEPSNKEQLTKEINKEEDTIIKENEVIPAPRTDEGKGKESEKKLSTKELFPSGQRLAELDKEYQKGVQGVEEGKTLNLNTSEFRYFSYLNGIKRKIELVWNYPEPAARAGQQGRLELAFTIRKDGALENVTLVKSSGYPMLDDEAISAIKVAAPYNKFPKGFNLERITIAATFEYIIEPYFYKQIR